MLEVQRLGSVGTWTGACLLLASAVAPLVTRPGDRSLPAMMPPLAFLLAVVVAERPVPPSGGETWVDAGVSVMKTLGANARWVVAATATAVVIAVVGHLVSRRTRGALPGSR